MVLRCSKRRKDGKEHLYWSVVENRRLSDQRVVQRHVLYLGELNGVQESSRRKTVELFGQDEDAPRASSKWTCIYTEKARRNAPQARLSLCTITVEVMGGIKAYCAVAQDPELLAKVAFTGSTVCTGKVNEVVGRCKNIHQAATENAGALVKYGITAAKLTRLDKAIKAFDKVKTAPRQHRVIQSAATQLIPVLVDSGVAIVRDQLDELMPQFKEANPSFFNAYFAARVVVNQGSRKRDKAEAKADATKQADETATTDAAPKTDVTATTDATAKTDESVEKAA